MLEYFLYQDSDDILRFISKLTRINEVIIDYSGKLGPGFSCFLTQSGFKLTKLSLSLQKFSFLDMKLISQECNRLKIFHIFFTNYTNNSNNCAKHALQMNHLEGKQNIQLILNFFYYNPFLQFFIWVLVKIAILI